MTATWTKTMIGAATALCLGLALAARLEAQPKVDVAALYKTNCQLCHGADGNSKMKNASFTDGVWLHGSSQADVQKVIAAGIKGTVMQSFSAKLKPAEIEALAKHVRAFDPKLK